MNTPKIPGTVVALALAGFAVAACQPVDGTTPDKKDSKKHSSTNIRRKPAGPILNQGQTGACTGFAVAGILGGSNKDAFRIYTLATKLDHVPGEYPAEDTGSTFRAAMKAAKKLNYIESYRLIHTPSGALRELKKHRVAVALHWPYETDSHAMVMIGRKGNKLVFQNSWGRRFGNHGLVNIPMDEYEKSFEDAAVVTG